MKSIMQGLYSLITRMKKEAADYRRPPAMPLTGPSFHGTYLQRQAIEKLEDLGWILLHWTEVPLMMAVMENAAGDVVFIDFEGRAWAGPGFSTQIQGGWSSADGKG